MRRKIFAKRSRNDEKYDSTAHLPQSNWREEEKFGAKTMLKETKTINEIMLEAETRKGVVTMKSSLRLRELGWRLKSENISFTKCETAIHNYTPPTTQSNFWSFTKSKEKVNVDANYLRAEMGHGAERVGTGISSEKAFALLKIRL